MVYRKVGKRTIDIILSFVGLLILLPVFLMLIIAIKLESQGPILFKQRRIGKNKREFLILKFRTMHVDSPANIPTHLLNNPEDHITRVGHFLRKKSLDELPQLINILKGDMSIVGPRPALWNQYDLITERDKYGSNNIYPGLTGWAQINGRDELPNEIKAYYDGEYTKKMSLIFDVKVFFKTLSSVVKSEGVN